MLLLLPASGLALTQPDHQQIAVESCRHAGLPKPFCLSVGRAAYDTDAEAWEELSAHGQIPEGGEACSAAAATQGRIFQLGTSIHLQLGATQSGARGELLGRVAQGLGRALHTIEDTCAHAGMPNPQHAFWSDSDVCQGTHLSPDVQPEALGCARRETDAALIQFVDAVIAAQLLPDELAEGDPSPWTRYPNLGEVCDFMNSVRAWDGVDRRWDNQRVLPALASAFGRGLTGEEAPPPICAQGDITRRPEAPIDVAARGRMTCTITDAFCLAGDAARNDLAPPFYTPDGFAALLYGCTLGSQRPWRSTPLMVGLALVLVGWRLARRRSSGHPAEHTAQAHPRAEERSRNRGGF